MSIVPIPQAGVIPFRLAADGQIEVLLIRRTTKQHWNIPKGINSETSD